MEISVTSVALPAVDVVGRRAAALLTALQGWSEFDRLQLAAEKYAGCWETFTGFLTVTNWNEEADKGPLFTEAMRVLALKATVLELTGDEQVAELMVSAPVDEMVHAVLAQSNLCHAATQAVTGMRFVHQTDLEEFGWEPGDYTEQCYLAAGWGPLPTRYWIPFGEYKRRLKILKTRYDSIGIEQFGRVSNVDFAENREDVLVGA